MATNPLAWLDNELAALDAAGLRRQLPTRSGPQSAAIQVGATLVNFGANDYLGLAAERLGEAAIAAIREVGWGSGASPLITGRGERHAQLERTLAEFEGTEAALLFSTGFAANAGTIATLVGPRDVIFSDAKNHASIIDGCRLSGATIVVYPHGDPDALAKRLADARAFRRRLIVTDTLFSMDGDLAPLPQLVELAEQHAAMLLVDEAHATGVFGRGGRGVTEHFGVEDGVHIRVGTLSKALGSIGGFVAGSQRLIDWLANRARTYVFSTAQPEAAAAASLEALRIVQAEPHRREQLLSRAESLRETLAHAGWNVGRSQSQVIPLIVGEPGPTMELATRLRERGLFVPGIRPPTVPRGESLLRISLSYAHTPEMLERLVRELGSGLAGCTRPSATAFGRPEGPQGSN